MVQWIRFGVLVLVMMRCGLGRFALIFAVASVNDIMISRWLFNPFMLHIWSSVLVSTR